MKISPSIRRPAWIWFILALATFVSWAVGGGLAFSSQACAGSAVLVIAFIKIRFVMSEFMELRHAPWWLRIAADLWCIAACALLVWLYLAGVHP